MNWVVILIILICVFGVGSGPWWGYSQGWGYGPSGGIVGLLVLLLVLHLLGVF
jgi:hypothetical protein